MTERRARYTTNQALNDELAFQMDAVGITYKREYRAIPGRRYCWDFLVFVVRKGDDEIPYWLIELNGGTWTRRGGHSTGRGIQRDYRKANLAVLNGWRQLTFTADDVHSGEALKVIMQALGMEAK